MRIFILCMLPESLLGMILEQVQTKSEVGLEMSFDRVPS